MSNLPEYALADLSGTPINQLGQFEHILDEAGRKGIISVTPENEAETYDVTSQQVRIQTIATRLWLLGYLPRKIPPKKIHQQLDAIKDAVAQFQREANLKQDNWVGNKTWYALDELVSFESELTMEQWFVNGTIRPEANKAVQRAVQLRLWSLGLHRYKPKKNFDLLEAKDLEKFGKVLFIFLVKDTGYTADLNAETLSLLFNQDLLTHAIARRASADKKRFLLRFASKGKAKQQQLAERFLVNCAKIELWLLGYDVPIDGKNDFAISTDSPVYKKMSEYYQQFQGHDNTTANRLARKITPAFFQSISIAHEENDNAFDEDEASEAIAKEMVSTSKVEKAWSYIKERGIRLWDGLKRLWRWMKKIGKKVISFLEENVFKAFFRYASKVYKVVKCGITNVVRAIGVYIKGGMATPKSAFLFSADMDTTAYFSKQITPVEQQQSFDALALHTRAFKLGCHMIGWLLNIFKHLATGFVGWAKLLVSMVKSYKELKQTYLEFKALGLSC